MIRAPRLGIAIGLAMVMLALASPVHEVGEAPAAEPETEAATDEASTEEPSDDPLWDEPLAKDYDSYDNEHLQEFLATIEELVLDTTDRALNLTKGVFERLPEHLTPQQCRALCPLTQAYVAEVERVQQQQQQQPLEANYMEMRRLFTRFRETSAQIVGLTATPQEKEAPEGREGVGAAEGYDFQLISDEFYAGGRNETEFDTLYLDFVRRFDEASRRLWRTMGERTVEEQPELLELLDEIEQERQLREKDKLYDEFIEMFLFKSRPN